MVVVAIDADKASEKERSLTPLRRAEVSGLFYRGKTKTLQVACHLYYVLLPTAAATAAAGW